MSKNWYNSPYMWFPYLQIQPTTDENLKKKVPEKSKKQNLNLPPIANYSHSIYIVFKTIYIAFILY